MNFELVVITVELCSYTFYIGSITVLYRVQTTDIYIFIA